MSFFARTLGSLHRLASRSRLASGIALKIRNQCDAIVRARLNDGADLTCNGEMLLIRQVAPQARFFVDVGANVGNWARAFLNAQPKEGRGLLFEPSPNAAARAREFLEAFSERVEIVEAALGDEYGQTRFFIEPECGESSSVVKGFGSSNAIATAVPLTTLSRELESRGLRYADFVKIDAEGYDLKVLKGAAQFIEGGRIGIVQFEYNTPWANAGSTLSEALELVGRCGYTTYLLKRDGLHLLDYQRYGEYLGYSNYVAVSKSSMPAVEHLVRGYL